MAFPSGLQTFCWKVSWQTYGSFVVCHFLLIPSYFNSLICVCVQLLSRVRLFATPWTVARQASQSFTTSQSLLKLMSTELGMPSNHRILCHPLLLLPSIFPSIKVFNNEWALHIGWPKYWSFCFSVSPSNEYSGLISSRIDWFFIFILCHLNYNMYWCFPLWVDPIWKSLCFLDLDVCFLSQVREAFSYYVL